MPEAETQAFPVIGYDEKGEQLKEPIGYITKNDMEVINRSRGTIKDPNGFRIVEEDLTEEEFKGKKDKGGKYTTEPIDITNFQSYQFPLPEMKWKKLVGRVKKIEWIKHEPDTEVYYDDEEKVCYIYDIPKKRIKKYSYAKTVPTDQEMLEFQLLQNEYIEFLRQNNMDVEITSRGEMMNTFKIIDNWGHTDKVDVFSRITSEERKNIILSRWIGATTWMPAIFTQIKGFLRLGHSVEEKGPLGTGRKSLIEIQAKSLEKGRRTEEQEEQGGFGLGNKRGE